MPQGVKQPWQERIWLYVERSPNCWLWTGSTNGVGYGYLRTSGKERQLAHRLMYQLKVGQIPSGMLVCHTCDVRRCVRPSHLFLGTEADNIADCIAKGRYIPYAARGPWPKVCTDYNGIRL